MGQKSYNQRYIYPNFTFALTGRTHDSAPTQGDVPLELALGYVLAAPFGACTPNRMFFESLLDSMINYDYT